MFIPWWHSLIQKTETTATSFRNRQRRPGLARRSRRLQLEALEERLVLAQPFYTVDSSAIPPGNVGTTVNVVIDISNVPLTASGQTVNGLAGGNVVLSLPIGSLSTATIPTITYGALITNNPGGAGAWNAPSAFFDST